LTDSFKPPFWQINGHIQTIYPSIFRKVSLPYKRERMVLSDGDFVDLDWVKNGSKKLILVTHGLEGDSTRHYVTGMIKKFVDAGFDGLGWNCRSCSGEINRNARFYHHGDAEDLRQVLEYAIKEMKYEEVFLAGYSMGGSLTLRLLAEKPALLPKQVIKAVAASVPLDIHDSVKELHKKGKRFYMRRFLRKLGVKIQEKSKQFPENPLLSYEGYEHRIKDFYDFDGTYTAPIHGYNSAIDFYAKASTKPILNNIQIPVKIVQALNDPFLSQSCFELGEAESNNNVELILTKYGGHVGFMQSGKSSNYVEDLALDFYQKKIPLN
jgi:predicted alpha/beta-fold hydrolase